MAPPRYLPLVFFACAAEASFYALSSAGGSITPSGHLPASDTTFVVTAEAGFQLTHLLLNGVPFNLSKPSSPTTSISLTLEWDKVDDGSGLVAVTTHFRPTSASSSFAAAAKTNEAKSHNVGVLFETYFDAWLAGGPPKVYPTPCSGQELRAWGVPLQGWYKSSDMAVANKQLDLMAATGIDYLVIDYSNNNIHSQPLHAPLSALLDNVQNRLINHVPTPLVTFLINHDNEDGLKKLWAEVYGPRPQLQFVYLDGKPLLLPTGSCDFQICGSWTVRPTWALFKQNPTPEWSFMQPYPNQNPYLHNGKVEELSVNAAQQLSYMSDPSAHGRQWDFRTGQNNGPKGINFEDQWDRADSLQPRFVFIKSWNEWASFCPANVDNFSPEFSNDIEPVSGHFGDHYLQRTKARIAQYKAKGQSGSSTVVV